MGIFEGAPLWVQITNAVLTYVVVLKWVWAFHKDREIRFDYETEEIIEKIESMDTESGEWSKQQFNEKNYIYEKVRVIINGTTDLSDSSDI